MRFIVLMAIMSLTLLFLPAFAQQPPVYIDANYGKNWLISTGNTQSDLWNWGALPKGTYYDYPYGNWIPSILMDYYPRGYFWPYYLNYPWGINQSPNNPNLYTFPPRVY
jgi:hypothetical protein